MRTIHHIRFKTHDVEQETALREAQIELKRGWVHIAEDDPQWESVASLAARFHARDIVGTEHSDAEEGAASFLGLRVGQQHGYPEPANDNGYLAATFDLSAYCRFCGIGWKQAAPFRMKKIPALGNSILQLNWIYDEYFVSPEVWQSVFEPFGIRCRPVVLNKTGAEIASVVQLDLGDAVELDLDDLEYKTCSHCGRRKYIPSVLRHALCPAPITDTNSIMFKSCQQFGDGARAFRLVLVSSPLYQKMKDGRLKGVKYVPCAPPKGLNRKPTSATGKSEWHPFASS